MLPVKEMTEGRSKERKTIEEEIEKGIDVEKNNRSVNGKKDRSKNRKK